MREILFLQYYVEIERESSGEEEKKKPANALPAKPGVPIFDVNIRKS